MTSISGIVNPEDYLLGRKIDKTFELSQQEKRDNAREARIRLIENDRLKLAGDPILDLERRKEQLKLEIISNPIKLKQLREQLLKNDRAKQDESGHSSKTLPNPKLKDQESSGTKDTTLRNRHRYRSPSTSSTSSSSSSNSQHRRRNHKRSKRRRHHSPSTSRTSERIHRHKDEYRKRRHSVNKPQQDHNSRKRRN